MKKPYVIIIMDGYAVTDETIGNAVKAANTPNLDNAFKNYPNTLIGASGLSVGLPDGQMGNSEVGHTNIGAGRIVYQELTRISKSINDGDFFTNDEFTAAVENCKKNGSALHLMGLVSDGGVHSHNSHLYALLELAKRNGLKDVYVHAFTDGRDVPPDSALGFIEELSAKIDDIGVGCIASVMGRFYAMDRESRWDRVEKAYNAMVLGQGEKFTTAKDGVKASYDNGVLDEFIVPFTTEGAAPITDNDSIVFFNFRPDRAREITRSFVDSEFNGFNRERFFPVHFICMTQYDAQMPNCYVAFKPDSLAMTMGEFMSKCGKTQLRIAETTKYAHVTFFFNGGREVLFEGEDRILVDTPDVKTFDLMPEMSAYGVCEKVCEQIESGKYDLIVLNFANCDMVGHTGVFNAAVKAVEVVDECVGKVLSSVDKVNGVAIITADHGNADKMCEGDNCPFTAHTTNLVPFIVCGAGDLKLKDGGVLADIAPTVIELMGLTKPSEMGGKSLIIQ